MGFASYRIYPVAGGYWVEKPTFSRLKNSEVMIWAATFFELEDAQRCFPGAILVDEEDEHAKHPGAS